MQFLIFPTLNLHQGPIFTVRHTDKTIIESENGFTLIELIIVIVILSILGTMGASFISQAFKGFADTNSRTEIYEEGKIALVRMEREIRNTVPNAVEISGTGSNTISFGVVDEKVMKSNIFGQYKESNPTGTNTIEDQQTAGLPVTSLISIYNTNWNDFSSGNRIYSITNHNTNPMTLDSNIDASSPRRRFYTVRDKAVRYSISGGTLYRSTADVTTGVLDVFGNAKPLAKGIIQTGTQPFFTYSAGTLTRSGVVTINFSISKNNETINFHKEVHIKNVP